MNAIGIGLKEKESANNELQNGMIMDMIDRTADKKTSDKTRIEA
jgi:hypothetical protein